MPVIPELKAELDEHEAALAAYVQAGRAFLDHEDARIWLAEINNAILRGILAGQDVSGLRAERDRLLALGLEALDRLRAAEARLEQTSRVVCGIEEAMRQHRIVQSN